MLIALSCLFSQKLVTSTVGLVGLGAAALLLFGGLFTITTKRRNTRCFDERIEQVPGRVRRHFRIARRTVPFLVTSRVLVKVGFRVGTGGQLATNTFDTNAGNLLEEIRSATKKVFMVVPRTVRSSGETTKAVEINLALEGGQLGLTEVSVKLTGIEGTS